jgi:hypothetical protein
MRERERKGGETEKVCERGKMNELKRKRREKVGDNDRIEDKMKT